MDTETGRIYSEEEALRLVEKDRKKWERRLAPMPVPPTETQMRRVPPRVGRNEPCPCGSGKKFKKCCLRMNYND